LGKAFLDIFKFLTVGLLISDFVFKAPLMMKLVVAVTAVGALVVGAILHR
jgi:hypothetical protein